MLTLLLSSRSNATYHLNVSQYKKNKMAISWNEIKDRALKFSIEWADESKERAEKDSFWNDFFNVFGKNRRGLALSLIHI